MRMSYLLRDGAFTEVHIKVMHLLRLIYENELFIKRWCIY